MKKNEALAVMNARIVTGDFTVEEMNTKSEVERQIRKLSDMDEGFENVVFELGCSTLAKKYLKENQYDRSF